LGSKKVLKYQDGGLSGGAWKPAALRSAIGFTVFLVAASWLATASAASKLDVIHGFTGSSDGARVFSTPLLKDGKLYVTTAYGGVITRSAFSPGYGAGTIDEFVPSATTAGAWARTTLYEFKGAKDGAGPYAALTQDNEKDVFFGVTLHGGNGDASPGTGDGTVFRLEPPTAGETRWHETILHVFGRDRDGATPASRVVVDKEGTIYGTTLDGGIRNCDDDGCGIVYKLTPPPAGEKVWRETVLYRFRSKTDGYYALGGLILDGHGGLFGTTTWGGSSCNGFGCGTVFHLTPSKIPGEPWRKTIIHDFAGGAHGKAPISQLVLSNGQLFGTTSAGGVVTCGSSDGCGVIFRLSPPAVAGQRWSIEILHEFAGGKDGAVPYSEITQVPNSPTFYGTTSAGSGGQCSPYKGCGTIYRLSKSGAQWNEEVLFNFGEPQVGGTPFGGVALSGDQKTLYGATARLGSKTSAPCAEQGCGKLYEFHIQQ
jgi:hypothetical protein